MKRPWNIVDNAVYSLATYEGNKVNMNICTYVTAISMQPKLYAIAIYNNTKTLENIKHSETAVLQFLHESQFDLVKQFGKKSGLRFDKNKYLIKNNLLQDWYGYEVLKNVSALVLLKKLTQQQTGDHVLFTFEAQKYISFNEAVLNASVLRDKKIILA